MESTVGRLIQQELGSNPFSGNRFATEAYVRNILMWEQAEATQRRKIPNYSFTRSVEFGEIAMLTHSRVRSHCEIIIRVCTCRV